MDFSSRPRRRTSSFDRLLLAFAAVALVWAGKDAKDATQEASQIRAADAAARRETDAILAKLRALETRRTSEDDKLADRAALTAAGSPLRVLQDISRALPPDVRLESVALGYGDGVAIDAAVAARDPAAYDRFLETLVASKHFSRVLPGDESREGEMKGRVSMTWHPEPRP
jgi:Tfp pilus assembly protein PilN